MREERGGGVTFPSLPRVRSTFLVLFCNAEKTLKKIFHDIEKDIVIFHNLNELCLIVSKLTSF